MYLFVCVCCWSVGRLFAEHVSTLALRQTTPASVVIIETVAIVSNVTFLDLVSRCNSISKSSVKFSRGKPWFFGVFAFYQALMQMCVYCILVPKLMARLIVATATYHVYVLVSFCIIIYCCFLLSRDCSGCTYADLCILVNLGLTDHFSLQIVLQVCCFLTAASFLLCVWKKIMI